MLRSIVSPTDIRSPCRALTIPDQVGAHGVAARRARKVWAPMKLVVERALLLQPSCSRPRGTFRVWAYLVSECRLLLRSTLESGERSRIDLYVGV